MSNVYVCMSEIEILHFYSLFQSQTFLTTECVFKLKCKDMSLEQHRFTYIISHEVVVSVRRAVTGKIK